MEWNFQFRIDHLKETGEERNLKGLIFTDGEQTPTPTQIVDFLQSMGYERVHLTDEARMQFMANEPNDPVLISIVQMGNPNKTFVDDHLKMLIEQIRGK